MAYITRSMKSSDFTILSTILFFISELCLKSQYVLTIVLLGVGVAYHPCPLPRVLILWLMGLLRESMSLLTLHTIFCAYVQFFLEKKGSIAFRSHRGLQ